MNMHKWLYIFCLMCGSASCLAADPPPPADNGMQVYYIGFLSRGERWTPEQTEQTRSIQAGHMLHIQAMAKTGKLLIAGPFMYEASDANQDMRGIFIFDVASVEEGKLLADEDPAIKSGRLKLEFRKWYGPAGLTYKDHAKYYSGAPGVGKP